MGFDEHSFVAGIKKLITLLTIKMKSTGKMQTGVNTYTNTRQGCTGVNILDSADMTAAIASSNICASDIKSLPPPLMITPYGPPPVTSMIQHNSIMMNEPCNGGRIIDKNKKTSALVGGEAQLLVKDNNGRDRDVTSMVDKDFIVDNNDDKVSPTVIPQSRLTEFVMSVWDLKQQLHVQDMDKLERDIARLSAASGTGSQVPNSHIYELHILASLTLLGVIIFRR